MGGEEETVIIVISIRFSLLYLFALALAKQNHPPQIEKTTFIKQFGLDLKTRRKETNYPPHVTNHQLIPSNKTILFQSLFHLTLW